MLHDKVQTLLKQQQSVVKENVRLARELDVLQKQVHSRDEQIIQLRQKIDAMKINSSALNEDVKKDLEKTITVYIKEIENCLSLLNA